MNYLKILTDKELTQSEKVLLMYLAEKRISDNGVCVSFKMLTKEIGMTRPTLSKAVEGLSDKGIIRKESNISIYGGVGANTYKIATSKYL